MHIWFGRPSSAQGRIPRGAAASLRACAVLLHPIPSPSSPTGSPSECVPWSPSRVVRAPDRASSSCDDCESSEENEDAWVETAGQACQLRAGGRSWGATTVMGPDGSLVHEAGNWLASLDAAHNKRRRRRRRVRHARASAASPWPHPNRLRGRGALGAA